MTKTTKEEINGSTLYFFKKVQVIWGLVAQMVTVIVIVLGAYYALRADVDKNMATLKINTEVIQEHSARLDKKHDEILILELNAKVVDEKISRIEKNLEQYMLHQGYVYNKTLERK